MGKRLARFVRIPFWIESSSGGSPSDVHLVGNTRRHSHVRNIQGRSKLVVLKSCVLMLLVHFNTLHGFALFNLIYLFILLVYNVCTCFYINFTQCLYSFIINIPCILIIIYSCNLFIYLLFITNIFIQNFMYCHLL